MKAFDLAELMLLAAIWGASFLFMRLGAHEFGAIAMAAVRVTGASLMLIPLLTARQGLGELRSEWRLLLLLGLLNSALPFVLFGFAALSITAGLSAILNATTPMWGALVAWLWLSQRLESSRLLGMALGFAGVLYLSWDHASFKPGGSGWAILACLLATLCYGTAANLTKQRLSHISPLTVATGSQLSATLILALPAALLWPSAMPGPQAWVSVMLLAVLCSALAYILYFRLMLRVGPANTMSVTFLLPVFAVLWGYIFLGEVFTLQMAVGCGVVLLGTALAVGLIRPSKTVGLVT